MNKRISALLFALIFSPLLLLPLMLVSTPAQAQESLLHNVLSSWGLPQFSWPRVERPPADVPEERIVQIGKSDSYALSGMASYAAMEEYLAPYGYKPKNIFGQSPVLITLSLNDDYVGCGCPKAFKEFLVMYIIEDGSPGTIQVVPDLGMANHILRRISMGTKFGTVVELGQPDASSSGFTLHDNRGKLLVQAIAHSGMPAANIPLNNDIASHSIGGLYEGVQLRQTFYRTSSPAKAGFKLFNPRRDRFAVAPDSVIGQTLTFLGFKPQYWMTTSMRNGFAWIP